MNLGKLLGTGKSIISGEKPAAYREDKRFYLPQFGSPKNPFAKTTEPAAPEAKAKTPLPAALVKTNNSDLPRRTSLKMPEPAAQGTTARATTWITRLNPAAIFAAAPADRRITPVQTELSLEKVKVVHNDLSDADVEIVPLKSRPAPEMVPASASTKTWAELGDRIMKATVL